MLRDLPNPDYARLKIAIYEHLEAREWHQVREDEQIRAIASRAVGGPFPLWVDRVINMVIREYRDEGLLAWDSSRKRWVMKGDAS